MPQEQDSWVNYLLTKKSGVYLTMRIRIALRKEGVIPMENERAEAKLIKESEKHEYYFHVTQEDVRTALYEGHEVRLLLWTEVNKSYNCWCP
jgi:hypothetical protein